MITRTPTDFERAYYAYQARIRRALHNPFPYDFYFKQGSLLETRFNLEEFKRERKAFGSEFARGQYSDEKVAADRTAVEQLAKQEGEDEKLASRNPSADLNNHKSLDRKLGRNLYLVVEGKEGWYFPMGELEKGELLHQVHFNYYQLFVALSLHFCRLPSAGFTLPLVLIWIAGS